MASTRVQPEMLSDDAQIFRRLEHGRTLLGPGWKCIDSFDDINEDAFEDDEEEEYVIMDLGTSVDTRTLQTEATYQLIGLDTPMPFLKIGENVFEGRVAPLIGDEVVFDVVRQEESQRPHYRPLLKTSQRLDFRGISLIPRGTGEREAPKATPKISGALDRGMFPSRPRRLPKKTNEDGDDEDDQEGEEGEGEDGEDGDDGGAYKDKGKGKAKSTSPSKEPIFGTRRSTRSRPSTTVAELTKALAQEQATPGPSVILTTGGHAPEPVETPAQVAGEAMLIGSEVAMGTPSNAAATPTPAARRGAGRPRGRASTSGTPRMVREAVAVASLSDVADIAFAGGLGDGNVRLDVAPNADPELLAAVASVRRGKPWTPGSRLTPAQEERLLRNLPASGPGSRGGRGTGRALTRGGRRGMGRRSTVDASGDGLSADFFGIGPSGLGEGEGEEEGVEGEQEEDGDQVMAEDEDDEDEMEIDGEV